MKRIYALLLNLFPKPYLEEYGDELQAVFNLLFDDAMVTGGVEVAGVILRELTDLPKAILHEYLRERRKRKMLKKFNAYFDFAYGSRREFFTAIIPFFIVGFILPMMTVLTSSGLLIPRSQFVNGIGIVLVAVLGILFLIGLGTGLPRWAMPYIGFASVLFSMMTSPSVLRSIQRWFPLLYQKFTLLGGIFYEGTWWFGLLVVVILFMVLAGNVSVFRRFRDDWTLPCFIPYGGVPFALMLTFEEYKGDEPFMFLAFLILSAGAWFYLQSKREWKRFGALFGAMALAMFIAASGKAILLPMQDWPVFIDPASWKTEAMGTIITWVWLALIMLVPLAIKLLPRAGISSHSSLPEG